MHDDALAALSAAPFTARHLDPEWVDERAAMADAVLAQRPLQGGLVDAITELPEHQRAGRKQLGLMQRHAVLVDVSIDQGGCFETSRPTTHSDPTYEVDGITHYCVANMPGAVPITSTYALTNATMPYVVHIADAGVAAAASENPGLPRASTWWAAR